MSKRGRATKIELKWRMSVVHEMKLMGYPDAEILQFINHGGKDGRDKNYRWGISFGTMRYYIRTADEASDEFLQNSIEQHFESAVKRWALLIRKFHKEGDNTNMVKATKELDELLGLRKTNINISGLLNLNDVSKMTEADLDAEIKKLEGLGLK